MITLLTLYQCDKFIIHRAKNTLLYVQCVQSRSNPQYLTLDHEQNLTNSTLYKYKQSLVPKVETTPGVCGPPPMFVLLIEISSKFIIICFYEVQILVL